MQWVRLEVAERAVVAVEQMGERPIAEYDEARAGDAGVHLRPGREQHVEALLLDEPADESDSRRNLRDRRRREERGVDAARDDPDSRGVDTSFFTPTPIPEGPP